MQTYLQMTADKKLKNCEGVKTFILYYISYPCCKPSKRGLLLFCNFSVPCLGAYAGKLPFGQPEECFQRTQSFTPVQGVCMLRPRHPVTPLTHQRHFIHPLLQPFSPSFSPSFSSFERLSLSLSLFRWRRRPTC